MDVYAYFRCFLRFCLGKSGLVHCETFHSAILRAMFPSEKSAERKNAAFFFFKPDRSATTNRSVTFLMRAKQRSYTNDEHFRCEFFHFPFHISIDTCQFSNSFIAYYAVTRDGLGLIIIPARRK